MLEVLPLEVLLCVNMEGQRDIGERVLIQCVVVGLHVVVEGFFVGQVPVELKVVVHFNSVWGFKFIVRVVFGKGVAIRK